MIMTITIILVIALVILGLAYISLRRDNMTQAARIMELDRMLDIAKKENEFYIQEEIKEKEKINSFEEDDWRDYLKHD